MGEFRAMICGAESVPFLDCALLEELIGFVLSGEERGRPIATIKATDKGPSFLGIPHIGKTPIKFRFAATSGANWQLHRRVVTSLEYVKCYLSIIPQINQKVNIWLFLIFML